MNLSRRNFRVIIGYGVLILVPLTFLIYLFRGFGLLSGMSGGVILLLIIFTLSTLIAFGLEKTR
jgi:hypothetical protein